MSKETTAATKRPRGRPHGSGIDDGSTLAAVADLLLANPAIKPSTAMKRAVRGIGDSHLRRLQVKWAAGKENLLAAARERAQECARQAEARRRAVEQAHLVSLVASQSLAAGASLPGSVALTLATMTPPPDSAVGRIMEMTKLIQDLPATHPMRVLDTITVLGRRLDALSGLSRVLDLEKRLGALDPLRHLRC